MKQGLKRILFLLAIPVLIGGIIHYMIAYKAKNILALVVSKESNNTYTFNAKKIEVSFWNKNLIVEDAQLISLDTAIPKTHYTIQIPKMYLGIHSWSDLLFNRRVAIDSCSIIDSKFGIHETSIAPKQTLHANINMKDIFASIEKTLLFLEVKSLTIQNTAFTYKKIHSDNVLSGSGINFSIQNLSKDNKSGHLLYSDDIQVNIKNQKWDLPDGIHSLSFKSLNFSGENQFFELDSFTVHSDKDGDKDEINLFTEKFFFNSLQLSSMYEKDILEIDTLLCIRPVLTIDVDNKNTGKKVTPSKDTSTTPQSIDKFLPDLFKEKHFNYINIEDGQILIKNKTTHNSNALVQKSNLKIYNLSLKENRQPYLKTDSILFGLKNITFVTPDSTFQVVASELLIINNDLILRNSFFGPTEPNSSRKSISFTAPEFRLININFTDLIQKRLNAKKAELLSPKIVVKSGTAREEKTDTSASGGIKHFYASLHEFRELVGIEKLQITNGDVLIETSDEQNTVVHMQGIYALVLPIHFLNSDSLVHIKHSMPEIKIDAISVHSEKMDLNIRNYTFDGTHRKNYADYVHLNVAQEEFDIEINKLYWEIFDWDIFQKYKRIEIKELGAQQLIVKATKSESKKPNAKNQKDLPDIRIAKLKIDELQLNSTAGNDKILLTGQHIELDTLRSKQQFFTWKKISGEFKDILVTKEQLRAEIRSIKLATDAETRIEKLSFNKKDSTSEINIKIPSITISGNIYSTDFSELNINKIAVIQPHIKYYAVNDDYKQPKAKKEFIIPIKLSAKEIALENASLIYEKQSLSDTMHFSSILTMNFKNLSTAKDSSELVHYDQLSLTIQKMALTNKGIVLNLPEAIIVSAGGSITSFDKQHVSISSDLSANWNGLSVVKNNITSNSHIVLEKCSGNLLNNNFVYSTAKPIEWQTVISGIVIHKGAFRFDSPTTVCEIKDISWKNHSLILNQINLQPAISKEEAFKKASAQFDYLTVSGKSVRLQGINVTGSGDKQSLYIRKVILDQFELSSSRDKNLPKSTFKLKEMPTKLIQKIPLPLQIDSVLVYQSNVLVHQIEAKSTEETTIPINNINALIKNVSNRNDATDSLMLVADAKILHVHIKKFTYTESYADSLSYFHASSNIIPGKFIDLNALTVPLASIAIDNGYSNKLTAMWVGNKHATIGEMDFIYKDLKVHLISNGDTSKANITARLESKLANDIIHTKNTKSSVIFFERNTQKQIFNYWLKALLQGVYSSAGIKSNKKYLNHYNRLKEKYHLPNNPEAEGKKKPI